MSNNAALDRLISEKVGGEPFAIFFSSGEGSFFPDGTEESSGSVVTASGRHYGYWTDWDDELGCLKFDIWDEMPCKACIHSWLENSEYLEALRAVGLDVTP